MKPYQVRVGVVCAALLGGTAASAFQNVTVDLQRIGDPAVTYLDPEFWVEGRMVIWQEQQDGAVWIADIDETDGSFIPPDGKGRLMGHAAPITQTLNGPEFGFHVNGPDVYYIGYGRNGTTQPFRTLMEDATSTPEQLTSRFDFTPRFALIPNYEPYADQCRLLYYKGRGIGTIHWRLENDASTEAEVAKPASFSFSGPRWIPDEFVVLSDVRENRTIQVLATNVLTGEKQTLTHDDGDKKDPFIFEAPEYPGERLMMALVDLTGVGVYRNIGGQWTRIHTVSVPADPPLNHFSAEPFVYNGHSYASVAVSDPNAQDDNKDIWIVSLDPAHDVAVRVSEDGRHKRVDPETYITADGRLHLYYYIYPEDGEIGNVLYVAHITIEE